MVGFVVPDDELRRYEVYHAQGQHAWTGALIGEPMKQKHRDLPRRLEDTKKDQNQPRMQQSEPAG
jgi:hypothetical protein